MWLNPANAYLWGVSGGKQILRGKSTEAKQKNYISTRSFVNLTWQLTQVSCKKKSRGRSEALWFSSGTHFLFWFGTVSNKKKYSIESLKSHKTQIQTSNQCCKSGSRRIRTFSWIRNYLFRIRQKRKEKTTSTEISMDCSFESETSWLILLFDWL